MHETLNLSVGLAGGCRRLDQVHNILANPVEQRQDLGGAQLSVVAKDDHIREGSANIKTNSHTPAFLSVMPSVGSPRDR